MTDSRSIDLDSRRLIRGELLTNMLVEAGAGSGKTQMLAERMAAGVASGLYQVEHIAAVTFTRKAASELRGRFHLALENELASSNVVGGVGTGERPRRIRGALSSLERFFAGTIHSFCARLLRERPVESGVSPGFTELDEVQDIELRKRAWRDFVASSRSAGDPAMVDLVEASVKPNDLDSAFATICLNDDVEFPPGDGICPDPKAAWKAINTFWNELQKHLPSAIDQDTTCPIQRAARTYSSQAKVSRHRLERAATIAALLDKWDFDSKIVQNRWGTSAAEKKRFKNLIEPLHADFRANVVTPYLSRWHQYIYRLAVTLLTQARNHAANERRRLNTLNYGDLLNLTAKVLRENAQVRRALQQKYSHLFVDEFQDTDPIQAEIVFLLAASEGHVREPADPANVASYPDWRDLPLRPGALFVVGDPKQSIYRFRRADIEIYNTVRARFSDSGVGRVLPLTRNFRSVRNLCEWSNTVFEKQFPSDPTPHSPRFAALDANDESSLTGGVFTITHTCDRSEALELDAAKIATYIRSEVDAGRRKFSDFLILTRKKRDRIGAYATALESNNIPVEISGAGAFGDSAEVQTLTVLLRAIADPQDSLSLVAVLRGPLFGVSDRELFAFRSSGGWFSIFQDANGVAGPQPSQSVYAALSALRQYYRWSRILPAAAALERILEHTGYLALAATTPDGVEAGDLLHAIDRVRVVVEDGGSLADAASALEADTEDSNEVESLPLEPGRTDVTRVMNLHKAKGLEADVVFLADPCGGFAPRVDVHIERQGLKAFGWFEIVRKSETSYASKLLGQHADWDTHKATESPYLEAEQDRLLYVAATRARQMLVVSRLIGSQKQSAWGVLNDFLSTAPELSIPQWTPAPTVASLNCSAAAQASFAAGLAAAQISVRSASWSIASVTAEARHIARITRSADSDADDPSAVVSPNTPARRADAGMAWGTLIHGLLEHAMRHTAATPFDLRRLGMWLTVEEPQLRPVLDLAVQTVLAVSEAAFWTQAHESDRSVETPFSFAIVSGALVTGVIDLLFNHEGHWTIIDYKTDVGVSELAGSYQEQLKMYARALAAVGIPDAVTAIEPVRKAGAQGVVGSF
ncbi:MAG: UvrD-helicase domain-containing protein [Bryobacteraceae bacterium]